jgi:hypothetical protein
MSLKKGKRLTSLGPTKNFISYVDDSKKSVQCIHSTPVFDKKKSYHCMWCTFPIANAPIGCPVKRVTVRPVSKPQKVVDEEDVVKKEDPSKQVVEPIIVPNSYQTTGVFCSFNCVMAFIQDHSHDVFFAHSERLLASMYCDLTGGSNEPVTIRPAPHYTNLSIFGGEMSEVQFKQSFDKIVYVNKGRVNLYSFSTLFEEIAHL